MSKKINPTSVGLFVTGALFFMIAGLFILGSGQLFEKRGRFVTYFESSANGLSEGSDVLLGGVKVGSVVNMRVQFDPETRQKVIPVVIELSADRIVALSADTEFTKDTILSEESLRKAVDEQGLRARLMSKSALTGQLYVDLEFLPDEKGYLFPKPIDDLPQIPSVKNQIQQVLEKLSKSLEDLGTSGIGDVVENFNTLITNLDAKIAELDLKGISDKANSTLAKAETTFTDINEVIGDGHLKNIVADIEGAAAELKDLVAAVDADGINAVVKSADSAIDKVGVAAENFGEFTDQRSTAAVSLHRALAGIERATRSIQDLADYLKRNPNAVISGRKRP